MIIVSQDKRIILNFNNIKLIELDTETDNRNIFAYIDNSLKRPYVHLGGYATEERTKEVLQEIIEMYLGVTTIENTNIKRLLSAEENYFLRTRPHCYYMPKE